MATLPAKLSHVVREIAPERIKRNPENPRLVFRTEELDTLMLSIRKYGIQVPITVYEEDGFYVLIDGERRWRCASKLNLARIPALVQQKPTPLNNLLLMFNIHALREQWDYLTIANKLPKIIDLFSGENGRAPNEIELSELTGLTRGQIRRCRLLLDLPEKYREVLFAELDLPKAKQRLSEDFFIEMERSLKTVSARLPEAMQSIDSVRDVLISKYRNKIINNVVDLRKISKIATSVSSLGVDKDRANQALGRIFDSKTKIGVNEIFEEEFETRFDEKKIVRNLESVLNFLDDIENADLLEDQSPEILDLLARIGVRVRKMFGS